ncbi:MAG: hypothetical protein IPO63_07950 [Bacteroidetes bacterium]|nr:hypothetical protein [Bacteroidota bacterium]
MFKSTNNGASWTEVNTGLSHSSIQSLAINNTNIFAGTASNGVFLSQNNGLSWNAVNNGITGKDVYQ